MKKQLLATTLLAATATFAFAGDQSLAEKTKEAAREARDAVVDAARNVSDATQAAWQKTKAYMSEDPDIYRTGANQTLADIGTRIGDIKAKAPLTAPTYFKTRVQALDEQLAYARDTLAVLTPAEMKTRTSGPRYALDRCVSKLEDAVGDARSEADSLSKTVSDLPEK